MQLLLQRFKSAFENLTDSYHMENIRQHKIQKYEEFVDKSLKLNLLHATAQRDKVFEQQKILYPFSLLCIPRFMFRQKFIASIATSEELETLSNIPQEEALLQECAKLWQHLFRSEIWPYLRVVVSCMRRQTRALQLQEVGN
ncbi:hypothetical protein P8452_52648 [Trifolium repens]|nr:hypothetical protein P8452_52648 [Trifolium repens]